MGAEGSGMSFYDSGRTILDILLSSNFDQGTRKKSGRGHLTCNKKGWVGRGRVEGFGSGRTVDIIITGSIFDHF